MRAIGDATYSQLLRFRDFNAFFNTRSMASFQGELRKFIEEDKDKPFYRAYLNIVRRTAELINTLGIKDNLVKCSFFYYLLWSGFFSQNHKFIYQTQDRISNLSALGADIMLGKAACLNNADMLSRILRSTGAESYIMACDVPNIKANPALAESSKLEIHSILKDVPNSHIAGLDKGLEGLKILEMGNHAVSLFNYQDAYYLADPTNLTFLSITDLLEATYTGEDVVAQLKPKATLMLEDIDAEYFKELIFRTFLDSDRPPLSEEIVKARIDEGLAIICNHLPTLFDFYDTITPDIEEVCQTLK